MNAKNSMNFTQKLIQEVFKVCKNDLNFLNLNQKVKKLNRVKVELIEKDQNLDILLKKAKNIKEIVTNKNKVLVETNNNFKNKLLQILNK